MPAVYLCQQCHRKLRVSDASRGRSARCPACDTVQHVAGDAPEDPQLVARKPVELKPAGEPRENSLPWERDGASPASFVRTAFAVLLHPLRTFSQLPRDGGKKRPFWFAYFALLLSVLLGSVGQLLLELAAIGSGWRKWDDLPQSLGIFAASFAATVLVGPLGLFLNAGAIHLFLLLMNGANQRFAVTFRAISYVAGATSLLTIVPVLGSLAQMATIITHSIVALRQMQQCTILQAVVAVLFPLATMIVAVVALVVVLALAIVMRSVHFSN